MARRRPGRVKLWTRYIKEGKYDCFETFETFIIGNKVQADINEVSAISTHLTELKNNI